MRELAARACDGLSHLGKRAIIFCHAQQARRGLMHLGRRIDLRFLVERGGDMLKGLAAPVKLFTHGRGREAGRGFEGNDSRMFNAGAAVGYWRGKGRST